MKLFYKKRKTFVFSIFLFLLIGFSTGTMSQTTLTTTFANNNGFSLVTMNFTNNNPGAVIITDIASVCGVAGSVDVKAFYKTSAINGATGMINAGNGWNQFGSATITGIANTTTTASQPFMSGLTLIVPGGTTYGLAVEAGPGALRYSTVAAGTYTTLGGGCVLTSGSNVSFAGDVSPNEPTFTPRGFIGSITFIDAAPCAGTPAPGNTVSTATGNSVCPTIPFTLSAQNPTGGSGISYQWQSSPDGTAWTDIGGATQSTYTTSITVPTWYRLNATCSGNTGTSTALLININGPASCYCAAGATSLAFEKISNVTYNTINNSSTATAGYENFLTISTTVVQQSSLPITVTIAGPFNTDQTIVWIDFDHNGSFNDPGERVFISAPGVGPHTGNITIPTTSLLGPTRMRVRMHDSGLGPNAASCGNSTYGQVEDYTVDIQPCIQGVINTSPNNASINCGGAASFAVGATGSILTYAWEQRVSATAPWTNVTDGGVFSGATTATLSLANIPQSMTGYQYRALVEGPCTAVIFSGAGTLTVGAFIPNVSPASGTLCEGSGGNVHFLTTAPVATATATTGTIALNIPDNTANGVQSNLSIAGIPPGATVTDISVTLNMTHTYVGDMIFNLKAPNGKILALDKYMGATGNQSGPYPNTGFTNTIVSSNGVNPFSGVTTQPVTGTFKADGFTAAIPFAIVNPTGYVSNVPDFSGLYSAPTDLNGGWTLAMADGGPADFGILTSWTITVTYLSGPNATATWSPVTGLWMDAGLTIPYDGSVVGGVYAAPAATTVYTLNASTPICSGTGTATVTVNSDVDNVSVVANQPACDGGNASFSVTADGGIIDYQWQESTDAGATWTNVVDGGVYSGANSGTLTLTGVDATFNNYMYQVILNVASCNTATSNPATLTINPNAVVVIEAGPYTQLYPGLTTTLTAAVSPNAASSYQWYKNGVAIPGATGATYVVDVDGLGDYYVVVNDVNTCAGTSNTKTISDAPNDILFIYPSPNSGQFKVRYQSRAGNSLPRTLTIYDSKGARVFYKTYDINAPYGSMDVDMGTHSRGIYRVELGDRNGVRIKTGSVLIQ